MTNTIKLACRISISFIVILCNLYIVQAQPTMYKTGGTSGTATGGFSGSNTKFQLVYLPGDLTNVTSGNITKVFFRWSSGASKTYANFTVSLGQPASAIFSPASTFHTGLTQVLNETSYTINTTGLSTGDWIEISLTTPFVYDETQPLVVEIIGSGGVGSNTISCLYTSGPGSPNHKKVYTTTIANATGTTHTLWQDMGFTVEPIYTDDAGIISIDNPTTPATPGINPVEVTFRNYGSSTLNNVQINWSVNGMTQTPYTWTGSLAQNATTTTSIGNFNFSVGVNQISASTSLPNGQFDGNPNNDEIFEDVLFCTPISGTVQLNAALSTDVALGQYQNFNDLSLQLSQCGISGNVIVNVAPNSGPYNEQVVFNTIPGAGPSARVTINGNGNVITTTTTAADRYIIKLENTSYLTIDSLNIVLGTYTSGWMGVHLLNSANNITLKRLHIDMTGTTSTLIGGIVFSGSTTSILTAGDYHNITCTKNTIIGGGYGISVYGLSASQLSTNILIDSNIINDFSSNGIYIRETDGVLINANKLNKTAGGTSANAIQIAQTANINAIISNNYISVTQANSSLVGIYLFAGTGHKVFNNVIYKSESLSGNITGIQLRTASTAPEVYNNTISFDHTTTTTGNLYGIRIETANTNAVLRNNIVSITQPTSGFKCALMHVNNNASNINTGFSSNYNVFWVPDGNVAGYMPVTTPTLLAATFIDWQTGWSHDANSYEADPFFESIISPIPTNGIINDVGTPYGGLTTDVLGNTRGATPDPGAYEFSPSTNDAAITNFIPPSLPFCGNTLDVYFELANAGSGNLTSATINWSVNGVAQPVYNWTGNIVSGNSEQVMLGSFSIGAGIYEFSATVSNPNGGTDANAANNTFTYNGFRKGLSGIYTIDQNSASSATNFISFKSAADTLATYGICGSITLDVVMGSGPYNEQVLFNTIPGADNSNMVTINGNNEIIQYTATAAFPLDYTIKLDSVHYFIIENLQVKSLHATNGTGIYLTRRSSNDTIRNCIIEVSKTSTTSSTFPILVTGASSYLLSGTPAENLGIIGNTIIGGYTGIQFTGNSFSSLATKLKNSTVAHNTVQDFYGYGIYLNYTDNVLVDSNTVSRPTRTSSGSDSQTPAGLMVSSGSTNFTLSRNTVADLSNPGMAGTPIARGIYVGGTTTAVSSGNIVNNLIYGFTNTGSQYGIQNNSAVGPINIYHNTVALNHDANSPSSGVATAAMYMSNSSAQNGTDIRNNIFYITRGGSTEKRVIDVSSASSSYTSNNNVLYIGSTSGTNVIGRLGSTNYTDLIAWKGTGKDVSSTDVDPQFANPSVGDYQPTAAGVNDIGAAVNILIDIIDNVRSTTNPDPGAYEFTPASCINPPNAGVATASLTVVCPNTNITLNLSGNSEGAGQTYQWQSSIDGISWTDVGSAQSSTAFTTSQTDTTHYRCLAICNAGTPDTSTVVTVYTPENGLSGIFTINKTIPSGGDNFTSFADALDAMKCGISGPVVMNVVQGTGPYNEQIIINEVLGMSATNTLAINGNGETVNYFSTVSTERGIIKLNGADYVTIDSLVIDGTGATSTSQYAYGVQIMNDADNNTIKNCTINLSTTATSTSISGIIINTSATGVYSTSGNSQCDNNLIENNIITGGYAGIAFTANSSTAVIHNNKAINNTITDFYSYGIHINGNNNAVIEGNEISRPTRTGVTTFYGINLENVSTNTSVSKNKIHTPFGGNTSSTSSAYGIRLNNCDATVGNENIISNNIVYNFYGNTSTSAQNGILVNSSDNAKYYHNSISLDDASASCNCPARGLYVQNTNTVGLDIRNNIFTVSRGGTGQKQGIFFEPTSIAGYTLDNNNYYILAGSGIAEIGRIGGASGTGYTDLLTWQTGTGKDANSFAEDPMYTSPFSGDLTPLSSVLDDKGVWVDIATDIMDITRSMTTPDMGAYEFGNTVPVTYSSFTGRKEGSTNLLEWTTATEANNIGFELQRSADGRSYSKLDFISSKADNGNSNIALSYTYNDNKPLASNNYYRLKQMDKDGRVNYSNVVLLKGEKATQVSITGVYPNPTRNTLNVSIASPSAERVSIVVTDISGKVLIQQQVVLNSGDNIHNLDVSRLSQGTYLIKTICNNGCESAVIKFAKY